MLDYAIIVISCVLSVFLGYTLFLIWPKTGKMGINTKTVSCPRCGLKAPILRRPANLKEVLWGGWTCTQCKCKFDKYGSKINT